jgi:hypothetical protein
VGGGDVSQSGARLTPLTGGHVEPVAVHRDRDQAGAGADQGAAGAVVAGVLDPRRVAGVQQQPGGQVQAGLGAADHEDPVGSAADAPGHAQVGGDGIPQRPVAGCVLVAEQPAERAAGTTGEDASPHLVWEGVKGGYAEREGAQPGPERVRRPQPPTVARHHGPPRGQRRARRRLGRGLRARREGQPRSGQLGDGGAGADLAVEVALVAELLVGGQGGGAGDGELCGQAASGWQPGSGSQLPGQDRRPKPLVELAVHGQLAGRVQGDPGRRDSGGALRHDTS